MVRADKDKLWLISASTLISWKRYFSYHFNCGKKMLKWFVFQLWCFCSVCVPSLIPSINFISPLNRHYVKMRQETRTGPGLSGIFKFAPPRPRTQSVKSGQEVTVKSKPHNVMCSKHQTYDIMVSLYSCNTRILITGHNPNKAIQHKQAQNIDHF